MSRLRVLTPVGASIKLEKYLLGLLITTRDLPDWREAAQIAFQTIFPQLLMCCFLLDLERIRPLALSHGIDIQIFKCKI